MALDAAARTHPGKQRTSNEDALLCRPNSGIFAVIDGMGGEEAGEVAAAIAIQALAEVPDLPQLAGETVLVQAMHTARDRILAEADTDPGKAGMGAVGTALRFDDSGSTVSVAHVGDSRAYLIHAGGVRQITRDHLGEAQPGRKAQVARDLGRRDLRGDWVDTTRTKVWRGDLLILCSDGLHDVVAPEQLAEEMMRLRSEAKSAEAVATRLVSMALAAGGPDNITVVAIRVGSFRRRGGPRGLSTRFWQFATVVVLLAGFFAGVWWWRSVAATVAPLPGVVSGLVEIGANAGLVAPSATQTLIESGGLLRVAGERIRGGDWTLRIAPKGAFQVERSVIALERELRVEVAADGDALFRDVRVESGRLLIVAAAGSRVILEHVSAMEPDSLVIEGEGLVSRTNVQMAPQLPAAPEP